MGGKAALYRNHQYWNKQIGEITYQDIEDMSAHVLLNSLDELGKSDKM